MQLFVPSYAAVTDLLLPGLLIDQPWPALGNDLEKMMHTLLPLHHLPQGQGPNSIPQSLHQLGIWTLSYCVRTWLKSLLSSR